MPNISITTLGHPQIRICFLSAGWELVLSISKCINFNVQKFKLTEKKVKKKKKKKGELQLLRKVGRLTGNNNYFIH